MSLWCIHEWDQSWLTSSYIGWSHVVLWEYILQEGIQIIWQEQSDKEYSHCNRFNENDYLKVQA
jgi:hypothetical protein